MNGKKYLPPPNDESDFKQLFQKAVAAGAGRPLEEGKYLAGPWTPELLAEAISQIDSNRTGIELRTVQLWFQKNSKGVSAANIRWLAKIFGCNDPVLVNEWQLALKAAQERLKNKRRCQKDHADTAAHNGEAPDNTMKTSQNMVSTLPIEKKSGFNLALRTESAYCHGQSLSLPTSVLGGMIALGFLSFLIGIHNVTYERADGVVKQVGFLWTANWTLIFMLFMPLFFAFVADLVSTWKSNIGHLNEWQKSVNGFSYLYWVVFSVCLLFAGLFQWIGMVFLPLVKGTGKYSIDWSKIAIERPDIVTVQESVLFTALAYVYMSLCFYLFFAGFILLCTLVQSICNSNMAMKGQFGELDPVQSENFSTRAAYCIFRCTLLGILVAISMKSQSAYLASSGTDILSWLVGDSHLMAHESAAEQSAVRYRMPTHYTSLVVALISCFVFLFGLVRLKSFVKAKVSLPRLSMTIVFLFLSYLLFNSFPGSSLLLMAGVLLAIYGLFDPEFTVVNFAKFRRNQRVS
ncbi:putative membrane protein [Roseibium sp. TrichSKD4]|nr:putative membrane protein [Roseibium sp. TrichSKD4]